MSEPNLTTWPDLFLVREFLTPVACRDLVSELSAAQADAAAVYGRTSSGLVDQSVRQTLRLRPSDATRERVIQRLLDHKTALEQHFNLVLGECEEPQFLRYREGDFFVAHQDGNTGLIKLDTESRLVSIVIFLSRESDTPQPDAYCGGALVFTDLRPDSCGRKFHMRADPGTLVAFRAETTHEVTPVTQGERYSITSWFR